MISRWLLDNRRDLHFRLFGFYFFNVASIIFIFYMVLNLVSYLLYENPSLQNHQTATEQLCRFLNIFVFTVVQSLWFVIWSKVAVVLVFMMITRWLNCRFHACWFVLYGYRHLHLPFVWLSQWKVFGWTPTCAETGWTDPLKDFKIRFWSGGNVLLIIYL